MNTPEMHVAFRQYAQQMGMQNVRAILPEQIDILINQSIMDKVNQIIRENIGVTNDRVITDNSKIGQINDLRTLYKVDEVEIKYCTSDEDYESLANVNFIWNRAYRRQGLIKHKPKTIVGGTADNLFGHYMFLVDISINYQTTEPVGGQNQTFITAWYPVRIIDSAFLADTLNDYLLRNRFRSPIACIYGQDTLDLYIEKFDDASGPQISKGNVKLVPHSLRIDSIQYPKPVKYIEDISDSDDNEYTDLPEYMHGDIVRHAVDLYRIAVSGALNATQQQEQLQQQENVRNNYRNEGNQN